MKFKMPYLLTNHIEEFKLALNCQSARIINETCGGNSLIFCVETEAQKLAVKIYPPHHTDQRNRLDVETKTYQFLNKYSIPSIPRLVTTHDTLRWLIIEWIEGEKIDSYSDSDIQQAIQFITCVHKSRTLSGADTLPLAAEACLSLEILINQIDDRLTKLTSLQCEHHLNHFLTSKFSSCYFDIRNTSIKYCLQNSDSISSELKQECRSLIPADFGFHNAIRNHDGKLSFFDFDYFGWDDPVKLLSDIIWHPKMQLDSVHIQQFIEALSNIYQDDPFFMHRLNYMLPLIGLRWVLILLNEYNPKYKASHEHLHNNMDHNQRKIIQLKLAEQLLDKVASNRILK